MIGHELTYRIWVFPGKSRLGVGISESTANIYVKFSGELSSSSKVSIEKQLYTGETTTSNCGVLTSCEIGHDSSGWSPDIFIECVLIRCEITGRIWRFRCGQKVSKQRGQNEAKCMLVSEEFKSAEDQKRLYRATTMQPTTTQHQSQLQRSSKSLPGSSAPVSFYSKVQLQNELQASHDRLIQYFCSNQRSTDALTKLFFSEKPSGFIKMIAFSVLHGTEPIPVGLFRQQYSAWDVVEATVKRFKKKPNEEQAMAIALKHTGGGSDGSTTVVAEAARISDLSGGDDETLFIEWAETFLYKTQDISKVERFERWAFIALRDSFLGKWLPALFHTIKNGRCDVQFSDDAYGLELKF